MKMSGRNRFSFPAIILLASLASADADRGGPVGPGSGRSPWDDRTFLTFSRDGIVFRNSGARLLFEHASVPDLLAAPDGRILVYFVDFAQAMGPTPEHLSVGVSEDSGVTWRKVRVTIEDLSPGKAVDPDAVLLPDGRIRLYYYLMPHGRPRPAEGRESPHRILSAVSRDGIHFREEQGDRFVQSRITDPDVVHLPDGKWRMFYPAWGERGGPGASGTIRSATSEDGLNFS